MNDLISIIMPVYNTPPAALKRAVQSVLNQTYGNFELIVVDDGSDDSSTMSCLDIVATLDSRIKIIRNGHMGVSAARNNAIKHARGVWLAFSDSDDEYVSSFLEEALQYAHDHEADMVIGKYCFRYKSFETSESDTHQKLAIDEYSTTEEIDILREEFLSSFSLSGSKRIPITGRGPVAKLYRSILVDGLTFDQKLSQSEDMFFNFEYLSRCRKVIVVDRVWYVYYQNAWSTIRKPETDTWIQSIDRLMSLDLPELYSGARRSAASVLAIAGASACLVPGIRNGLADAKSILSFARSLGCFSQIDYSRYRIPRWRMLIDGFIRARCFIFASALLAMRLSVLQCKGKEVWSEQDA